MSETHTEAIPIACTGADTCVGTIDRHITWTICVLLALLIVQHSTARAQATKTPSGAVNTTSGSAGSKAALESRIIVDLPTAGVLTKNYCGLTTVVFAGGGLLADLAFAPMENFNIGIGYSGVNILGSGDISWQGSPTMHLRVRALDETLLLPAIVCGLQTQGRGQVHDKHFETAAPGLFVSASKQFTWLVGTLAIHGGAGYSLDVAFNGKGFNAWTGVEQSLGSNAAVMAELNPTLNDSASGILFNMSLRWVISNGVTLEFQARDLFCTLPSAAGFTRTLSFEINRAL